MFGDVNSVTLLGNITNDITVRYTPSGSAVCSFGLATNRRYKVPNTEDWKDEPTFHNIVLFGKQAEFLAQKAKKGTRVYVTGRLQTRTWKDKDDKTNYKTEIVSDRMLLIDRYDKTPSAGKGGYSGPSNDEVDYEAPRESKSASSSGKDSIIDPDDLPF
jgi:single-strand DNA-binding protein